MFTRKNESCPPKIKDSGSNHKASAYIIFENKYRGDYCYGVQGTDEIEAFENL